MRAFLLSFAVGAVLAGVGVGLMAGSAIGERQHEARRGWELKQVVLAARQLAAGSVIRAEDLAQKAIPEQFVTDSFVPPSALDTVIGQRLRAPLEAGDPLLWVDFALRPGTAAVAECIQSVRPAVDEAGQQTMAGAMAEFRAVRWSAPVGAAPEVPPLKPDSSGQIMVVVTAVDAEEGRVLTREDLAVHAMPAALVTASNIPGDALDNVVGAAASVPMMTGDPLLWQFVDDPDHPGSVATCVRMGEARRNASREATARMAVRSFFDSRMQQDGGE